MKAQMRFIFKPPLVVFTTEFKAAFSIWEYCSYKNHKVIYKQYTNPGKLGNLLGNLLGKRGNSENRHSAEGEE